MPYLEIPVTITIRTTSIDDAEALAIFLTELDNETELMLFNPGERKIEIKNLQPFLQKLEMQRSIMLIAINEQHQICGFVFGEVPSLQRTQHVIRINMGVLKAYRHTRVTYRLTQSFRQHAIELGIKRGEATIIRENKASLAMCEKLGFVIEGIKKGSIKINDHYFDEICLAYYL